MLRARPPADVSSLWSVFMQQQEGLYLLREFSIIRVGTAERASSRGSLPPTVGDAINAHIRINTKTLVCYAAGLAIEAP
jgi:hypothetical protein